MFAASTAFAYIPPGNFIFSHMAAQRDEAKNAGILVSVYKPAEGVKAADEYLGDIALSYPANQEADDYVPGLAFLVDSNAERLTEAMRHFGLAVPAEKELLRLKKEQYTAMKDLPQPFYQRDKAMSLRRYKNAYAWVNTSADGTKSAWVEKDSFLPLALQLPCPEAVKNLSWLKSGDGGCELEYQNVWDLKENVGRSARAVFKKADIPFLVLKIDRFLSSAKEPVIKTPVPENIRAAVESLMR